MDRITNIYKNRKYLWNSNVSYEIIKKLFFKKSQFKNFKR